MNKKPEQIQPAEGYLSSGPIKEIEELGIMSDRTSVNVNFQNCNVLVWDHQPVKISTEIDMKHFHEGSKCCRVVCGQNEFSGWGICPKDLGIIAEQGVDLSKFKGGKLHFYIKGNVPSLAVSIGWADIPKVGAHV